MSFIHSNGRSVAYRDSGEAALLACCWRIRWA